MEHTTAWSYTYNGVPQMIIKAIEVNNTPFPVVNENEVSNFLESKLNLQLATIDGKGDPNIQPVWFS
ncbi:MAG: hypothetical protein E6L04_07880 [Thaumarchaeota archaeon]|nr:MAG: hypothetical protein E6L04_07880 [Nitrososphaerota archaeon]TLX89843.1 MAG: hypothetical protein E6K97_04455 [Nitrososphaerota archaeon]